MEIDFVGIYKTICDLSEKRYGHRRWAGEEDDSKGQKKEQAGEEEQTNEKKSVMRMRTELFESHDIHNIRSSRWYSRYLLASIVPFSRDASTLN